jgi:hypothetical protein
MTEEEWLISESPQKMREYLEEKGNVQKRKLRLFACACCRRAAQWFLDPVQHAAVDVLEKYADGAATTDELAAACAGAGQFDEGHVLLSEEREDVRQDYLNAAYHAAQAVAQATSNDRPGADEPTYFHRLYDTIMHVVEAAGSGAVVDDPAHGRSLPAQAAERRALAALLRCVMGNPFRLSTFSPKWRTDTAVSLARTMYDAREFSAMPILADALQDAGCDHDDILSHCRNTSLTHVRGCWVVDLVLGK